VNAALAHPSGQRRARDREARSAEDGFLPVQRQVIKVLRHQHLRKQPGCRDALVDDVGCHRRLDQCLASVAHPFAADVALHREHAGLVVELLGDVLTYAFEHAATRADYV
jgi:hypothetical protein